MTIQEKLEKLRASMRQRDIDAYIIPTADFHQSEHVGEHYKVREYMSGFTGSAGILVVTQEEACLWTDGRYFIQAADQLSGSSIRLMKIGEPEVPGMLEYLREYLKEGQTLGFDGRTISVEEGTEYEEMMAHKQGRIVYGEDLVDEFWTDRPPYASEPAFTLGLCYAGKSTKEKLADIRAEMERYDADAHVLTTLDDICWILNIRGNDVKYSPLILSYAIITMDEMALYIDERKLDDSMKDRFAADGISLHPYDDIYDDIKKFYAGSRLLLDEKKLNFALYQDIPSYVEKIQAENPEVLMKAIKNPVEIANIRKAQIKDSVAHIRFMKWLKENYNKIRITEISASEKLDDFRREMGNYIRPSFEPISAYGAHGAIIHYSSTPETDVELKEGAFLLTDTGAGFFEGSTDITRTYALGEVPQILKDHFTLTAISNLNLANAKFLKGCTGMVLDYLARQPYWERNLNYLHGTGHGVGYLLNVHEGPCGFRWTHHPREAYPFEPGMIITDEPGVYIEGSHGVRLENEMLVREGEKNEYGQFLYFEIITLIPFDLDAINPKLMSEKDKKHLNDYHRRVYETIAPLLTEEEGEWLKKYTREI